MGVWAVGAWQRSRPLGEGGCEAECVWPAGLGPPCRPFGRTRQCEASGLTRRCTDGSNRVFGLNQSSLESSGRSCQWVWSESAGR